MAACAGTSEASVETAQFRRINLVMAALWAGLFAIAIVLSVIPYSQDSGLQVIISSLVPIALLLGVGLPPDFLIKLRFDVGVSQDQWGIFSAFDEAF